MITFLTHAQMNGAPISDSTESGEQGLVLAIDIEGTYYNIIHTWQFLQRIDP